MKYQVKRQYESKGLLIVHKLIYWDLNLNNIDEDSIL
jgi:hypothetical protein